MALGPGSTVGPYQIVEQAGKGGMATVYKAYQPALERHVALKVLPEFFAEEPGFRERFHREAVAVARLRHPSILTVFDHGQQDGLAYIVTEYVDGGTLSGRLGQPLPVSEAVRLLKPVASALDYAHAHKVLHRDVKPSNVLLSGDGVPVLSDFGLARMMGSADRLTRADTVLGTPEYMSPEQCAGGEVGPASDQYALAVVAFEMLTGRVPYAAETPAAVILAQIHDPLPLARQLRPDLSPEVEQALQRGMAKVPADRFESCSALVAALEAAAGAAAAGAPASTLALPAARRAAPPRMPPLPAILIGGLVLLLLAAGAGWIVTHRPLPVPASSPAAVPPDHGTLIWEAKLDGKGDTDVSLPADQGTDPTASALKFARGSIEVQMLKPGGEITVGFQAPRVKDYVCQLQLTAKAGTDITLSWPVRQAGPGQAADLVLIFDLPNETAQMYYAPYQGDTVALGKSISVAGIQRGQTITVLVVSNHAEYAVYVGNTRLASGSEDRSTGVISPGFYAYGRSGSFSVVGLHYWAPPS